MHFCQSTAKLCFDYLRKASKTLAAQQNINLTLDQ